MRKVCRYASFSVRKVEFHAVFVKLNFTHSSDTTRCFTYTINRAGLMGGGGGGGGL